eukprot:TRINITY_DN21501_c0_g1_i1.p1 TRINITY_DN21501_c0_g1~~TRINITY_DN21501_c0_g1_i1.p1  ORF type:complete len:774 (-),score=146.88 TRINITY_DN21501_c0_g1_i1:43-2319(-)
MAPLDESASEVHSGGDDALKKYIDEDVPALMTKYDQMWDIPDPEETPYKTKYKARKILQDALNDLERLVASASPTGRLADLGREMTARLLFFLGKNYYYCEEVPTAEQYFNRALESYLRSPLRSEPKYFIYVQDVFNQLGMLWCNRHAHAQGMNYLRRSQIMFMKRPAAVTLECEEKAKNNYTLTMFYLAQAYGALKKPGLSARFCAETLSQQLEHNAPGARPQEIRERDPFDCKDWVRNCCSLSDFFANECMFWTAEYLMHSAMIMCEKCEEMCGVKPDNLDELKAECARDAGNLYVTRLKFARTCTEHPQLCEQIWRGDRKKEAEQDDEENEVSKGARLSFLCAADGDRKAPGEDSNGIIWDDIFPEVVYLEDEEAADNRLAEETEDVRETGDKTDAANDETHAVPADDVCGWLEIASGERVRLPVHFRSLHAMVQRKLARVNKDFIRLRGDVYVAGEEALAAVRKSGKERTAASDASAAESANAGSRPRMPSAAATKFEPVREIFKLANHYFGKALSKFLLDGWVTEHVRILQELSVMYRAVQAWDGEPRRVAAMMMRRIRMLAPLIELLNPRAYVAFYRQLAFEVGEIYQELYMLKAHGKIPNDSDAAAEEDSKAGGSDDEDDILKKSDVMKAAKCNELARKSAHYFSVFIETYHTDGKVPSTIDTDHTRAYLTARMNRARLRTKTRGASLDQQVEGNKLALMEYEWILRYDKSNPGIIKKPEVNMEKEVFFCSEMAGMLPSKLSRLAARRGQR